MLGAMNPTMALVREASARENAPLTKSNTSIGLAMKINQTETGTPTKQSRRTLASRVFLRALTSFAAAWCEMRGNVT